MTSPDGLSALAERLLEMTRASRVTVRLDGPGDEFFPVVAEACDEGVRSIKGDRSVDLRAAPTFAAVAEDLQTVIQDDVTRSEMPPPREVVERYGVRAQMLAPLVGRGRCVGTLSVHQADGPRSWSPSDRAALDAVRREIEALACSRPAGDRRPG